MKLKTEVFRLCLGIAILLGVALYLKSSINTSHQAYFVLAMGAIPLIGMSIRIWRSESKRIKASPELFRFCLASTILVAAFAHQILSQYTNTTTLVMLLPPTVLVAILGTRILQKAGKMN